MPHVQPTCEEIAKHYPSLGAVDDLDLPDLSRLEDEQLYAAGMDVVQNILREMSEVGRTRRQGGISELSDLPANQEGRSGPRKEKGHDYRGFSPGGAIRTAQEGVDIGCAVERSPHISPRLHLDPSAQSFRHESWHLSFCDRDSAKHVVVSDRPKESLAGSPRVAEEHPESGCSGVATGKSHVSASCQESDKWAHLFGFKKVRRRRDERTTHDGAACGAVLPKRSKDNPESGSCEFREGNSHDSTRHGSSDRLALSL